MSGPYILKVGDKVTFGHTNGYKLKAGDYAKQPNSEFQFIVSVQVTKVLANDATKLKLHVSFMGQSGINNHFSRTCILLKGHRLVR